MKKILSLFFFILLLGFSNPVYAQFTGSEITTLNGLYGQSSDSQSGYPYDLWRVLADNGYSALANDIHTDVLGGTPSSSYHVYKDTFWKSSPYSLLMTKEVAGYAPDNRFGWYVKDYAGDVGDTTKSTWGQLFSGPDTQGAIASLLNPNDIGFWINPNGIPGSYYFTDTASNGNDLQALIFPLGGYTGLGNDYLICLEDLKYSGNSDKDFQDMIIRLHTTTVPEPASLSLLGLGLIGLLRRKKPSFLI